MAVINGICRKWEWDGTAGNPSSGKLTNIVQPRHSEVLTFVKNKSPNYRVLVRDEAWLPPLRYSVRRVRKDFEYGGFADNWAPSHSDPKFRNAVKVRWDDTLNIDITQYMGGTLHYVYEPSETEKSRYRASCRDKLLEKVKNQSMNVAQMIAERQQTVNLVNTTARRFVAAFRSARKGDLREFTQAIGAQSPSNRRMKRFSASYFKDPWSAATGAWLEYSYAWRPLVGDIFAAMKAFEKPMDKPTRITAQTEYKVEKTDQFTPNAYVRSEVSWSFHARYNELIFLNLDDAAVSSLTSSASQIGLTNPALLAWELLPYSFVVDWFLPIGAYLSSLDAYLGMKFQGGCSRELWTRGSKRTSIGRGYLNSILTPNVYTTGSSKSMVAETWYDRYVFTSAPTPVLPRFKNPLSVSHALSGLSLLSQTFLRK